ncbi:MAG: hypothetical protein ACYDCN_17310 [Bacteroidia bacterium]
MKILEFIKGTFKDKKQNPCGREVTVFIFVLIVITSWIAEQFYDKHIPEFMFLGFIGVITAGIGLYTIEKPMSDNFNNPNNNNNNDENNHETTNENSHGNTF